MLCRCVRPRQRAIVAPSWPAVEPCCPRLLPDGGVQMSLGARRRHAKLLQCECGDVLEDGGRNLATKDRALGVVENHCDDDTRVIGGGSANKRRDDALELAVCTRSLRRSGLAGDAVAVDRRELARAIGG